jgi:hypothetical protein
VLHKLRRVDEPKDNKKILDTRKGMQEKIGKGKRRERGTKISFSISCLNESEL